MNTQPTYYDYIFTGVGCAAMSLLVRMSAYEHLRHKKILLIDKDDKNKNDRTFSFWEKESDVFSGLAYKSWSNFKLGFNGGYSEHTILPYEFKTIRGIDFYNYCKTILQQFTQLTWVNETVASIKNNEVVTQQNVYTATNIFNSIYNEAIVPKEKNYFLWQHFMGYVISTPNNSFNDSMATWMDANVAQQNGFTFMYVLPFSKTQALVEYTVFSEAALPIEAYEPHVKEYIANMGITDYTIDEVEYDKIPMSTNTFERQHGNVINIGSIGGATRSSTGFTFKYIQKQTAYLCGLMAANKPLRYSYNFSERKHLFFDKVMLNLLVNKKLTGSEIFSRLFAKNKTQDILAFINGDSTILQELKIMNSVQRMKYMKAVVQELAH
jgi:lycopene beta-cyclase